MNLDYLGLECHDLGDGGYLLFGFVDRPRNWASAFSQMMGHQTMTSASILQVNQVITVEPGM
jgi:Xaa-Pro dipeptidase